MRVSQDRQRRWRAFVVLIALITWGCEKDSTGPPPFVPQRLVDAEPAWSHDGSTIAFVRFEPSSLGPPGLYVMTYPDLEHRLVFESDPYGLWGLRFTGDDLHLIAGWNGSLVRFSLTGGPTFQYIPVNTSAAVLPDETKDGSVIVYARPFGERGTLWERHSKPYADSLLLVNGAPSYGNYPRFSEDDSLLAFVETDGVHVLRRSTGEGVRITSVDYPRNYHFVPRWLDSRRILFNEVRGNGTQGYYIVDRIDRSLTAVPDGIYDSEAISPEGDSIIVQGLDRSDPAESRVVLFVRAIASPSSTARQLTRYQP